MSVVVVSGEGDSRGIARADPSNNSFVVPEPQCPKCGYPLRGLPGLTCPECGHTRPPPTPQNLRDRVEQMRAIARRKALRCRHCRTPLEHLDDDGRCVVCGTIYDFPDALPPREIDWALATHNARRVPGWIVMIAVLAIMVAVALLFVVLVL